MTTTDLEARIQRLEDRQAIVDVVISYATSIDRGDWATYATLFTDPVHIDFSEAGLPAADLPRDAFTGFAQQALETWSARQHLSPNHQVTFDATDPDRASATPTCTPSTTRKTLRRRTSCAVRTTTTWSGRRTAGASNGWFGT